MNFDIEIKELLNKAGVRKGEIVLEIPPNSEMGDYAFPCFGLALEKKENPAKLASELAKRIDGWLAETKREESGIDKVEARGAYVNFFVNKKKLSESAIKEVLSGGGDGGDMGGEGKKRKWGEIKGQKKKGKIIIELVEPNTNKPLHLGHLRNAFLGMSVANILKSLGWRVIKTNLVNDRGVHICKSMLAYSKWGNGKTPASEKVKSDHFVGDYYVLFSKKAKERESLEEEALEMLRKWEEGDKKIVSLWKKMNSWALKGMTETYEKIGLTYDKEYYESQLYQQGKTIVLDGVRRGLFKKDEDGSVYADLEELGKKVLLRADGTAIYITQDIYLAKLKFEQHNPEKSIYVVGNEQDYHFRALFRILEILGFEHAKDCYHLSYGMVNLPEGKMKSREGVVVDADNIIEEVIDIAREEVGKRYSGLEKGKVERRAKEIGMAGLRFYLLKTDPKRDITYNPKESISFDGDTGPYVQYSYARIKSILRKNKESKKSEKVNYELLKKEEEIELIKKISSFKEVVLKAGEEYKPNLLCDYLLDLCHKFNRFYDRCPILKSEDNVMKARMELIKAIAQILKDGLKLLGIKVLEKM
jgi:arginyl-tRNA synthetase